MAVISDKKENKIFQKCPALTFDLLYACWECDFLITLYLINEHFTPVVRIHSPGQIHPDQSKASDDIPLKKTSQTNTREIYFYFYFFHFNLLY